MSSPPEQAYTDAPKQHPGLLLGSLHLLFWLFVRPAAWRNHVARIDPALGPDFALLDLDYAPWRNRALLRMLVQLCIVVPLITSILVGLILTLSGRTAAEIAFGMTIALLFGIVGGLPTCVVGSVAVGAVITFLIGPVFGINFAVAGNLQFAAHAGIARGMALGTIAPLINEFTHFGAVLGNLTFGLANNISATQANSTYPNTIYSVVRRVGGVVAGIFVGVVVGLVAYLVSATLASAVVGSSGNILVIAIGVLVGVMGSTAGALVGFIRSRRWQLSSAYSALGIPAFALGVGVLFAWPQGNQSDILFGIIYGLSCSLVLSLVNAGVLGLPMMIAQRIAGGWAGAIAGALSVSGFWTLLMVARHPDAPSFVALGFTATVLGLTAHIWRPELCYPLLMVYNLALLRLDYARKPTRPALLRFHAAFWDEHQRLRWVGLDEHVVLVAKRSPAEGRAAIEYLANSRWQRWAARAAQIELDAFALEQCADVFDIAAAHSALATGELEGPASALLRSFSRISQDVAAGLEQERAYARRLALNAIEERLDGLLRELTRSSERYAQRFRPIAARWRELIVAHARALATEAEQRQEIDNPYLIGVPLSAEQSLFVGRNDISARIEQLLLDRRRPPLLLYGQRRMGKTSLLNNMGRLLPSTVIPLFVDLQGPAAQASNEAGLFYYLARSMREAALEQRGLLLPRLEREALERDPFIIFDEWLNELERLAGERTALLMLDEFEVLDRAFKRGRFDEEGVLGLLRHIIQHRQRCKVLLAGSHGLDEFRRWSSYLINVQVVHIGYLSDQEAYKLIEQPVKNFELRYTPDASTRVLTLTRGHPFLVQLLCAEIVALKNEQPPALRRLARLIDVEAAVAPALASGDMFFADIAHNQLDADGRTLLQVLAAYGEGALVQQLPITNGALNQLLRRELVERRADRVEVPVELIRRWFAQL